VLATPIVVVEGVWGYSIDDEWRIVQLSVDNERPEVMVVAKRRMNKAIRQIYTNLPTQSKPTFQLISSQSSPYPSKSQRIASKDQSATSNLQSRDGSERVILIKE